MQVTTYRYRPSPGDRMRAIALALAVCALIFFMLIRMGLLADLNQTDHRNQHTEKPQPANEQIRSVPSQSQAQPRDSHKHKRGQRRLLHRR